MKNSIDFDKSNGLVPVIVQDASTLQVLMLAYMNNEAFQETLSTGKVTFFSRSRNALWIKGETSGNYFHLVDWFVDCDSDTLLVTVSPAGPACHRNTVTCFDEMEQDQVTASHTPPSASEVQFLSRLQDLLDTRKVERPEGSYTTRLFDKGLDKIAQKVGEEAVETVIAAKNDNDELRYEASDLLFHLMVLLTEKGMRIEDLSRELASRHKPG
jgi:phosphoribosyl-AMP cyclohydrolase / phosphoribosyl-ATP pyrophosphohydrolase